ncbi:MerR family transcriptional regulator [Bosea sp. PAMC 26642]|uniref:MerR family transcriptional regulator n=1 Tax=Bosea sp. (strain PAMC 26642) TaxID=1792307 RepID=UPI00076FE518|nr:helix-turn-helix domain-containing protein [Bosea sp. PAMC 26642]AMJ61703.1 MerR family transcriptional regulator [Bosea sp. PAMC 26642]
MHELPIGELSRDTGVKIPTIRFYEQIGLLKVPRRTSANRRYYSGDDVNRLHFIRHARELGFEIDDIRALLAMYDEPQSSCDSVHRIAKRHLDQIDLRIGQLEALRGELQRMVHEGQHGRICDCRVIEVLADHNQCRHDHARAGGVMER